MRDYHQYHINTQVINFQYDTHPNIYQAPSFLFDQWFDNDTPNKQTSSFTKDFSTTSEFHWSITEGISVTSSVSIDIGVPDIASLHASISTTVDFRYIVYSIFLLKYVYIYTYKYSIHMLSEN